MSFLLHVDVYFEGYRFYDYSVVSACPKFLKLSFSVLKLFLRRKSNLVFGDFWGMCLLWIYFRNENFTMSPNPNPNWSFQLDIWFSYCCYLIFLLCHYIIPFLVVITSIWTICIMYFCDSKNLLFSQLYVDTFSVLVLWKPCPL